MVSGQQYEVIDVYSCHFMENCGGLPYRDGQMAITLFSVC